MLKKIDILHINVDDEMFEPNFINLTKIVNGSIAFDEKTRFLDEKTKTKLNSKPLKTFEDAVAISNFSGKWMFVCDVLNEAYKTEKIKVHELTLPDTIQGMASNLQHYNAEAAPVVLIYENGFDFYNYILNNEASHIYQNEMITTWIYQGEKANELLRIFAENKHYYIADGHHRIFTSSITNVKDSIFASFISKEEVNIDSLIRIIPNVNKDKQTKAIKFLESRNMLSTCREIKKGNLKLTWNDEYYYIELVDLAGDYFWNNDVYRFNTQVLSQAYGIFDSSSITYIENRNNLGSMDLTDSVIIEINPLEISDFISASKTNSVLPPKSTLFSPKYPSLHLIKQYKEQ